MPVIKKKLPDAAVLRCLFVYDTVDGVLRRKSDNKAVGGLNNHGYHRVVVEGVRYLTHRLIWKMIHDEEPDEVDHINGQRDDNRLANLRNVSKKVNQENGAKRVNNTSGYPGVSWSRLHSKWRAQINHNGRKIHIGLFGCKIDAHKAYLKAKKKYHTIHKPRQEKQNG